MHGLSFSLIYPHSYYPRSNHLDMIILDCLLFSVNFGQSFWIVHLLINFILSSFLRMDSSEVGRAPHLISVKLIRATVFISVFLAVYTFKETIACLETKFAVECICMEVPNVVESIVT